LTLTGLTRTSQTRGMSSGAPAGGRVRAPRHARELSLAAGAGLVCFEAAELAWLGFQPLEAVFAVVDMVVIGIAWRLPRPQP
jgi:hypothetical protein